MEKEKKERDKKKVNLISRSICLQISKLRSQSFVTFPEK